MVNKFSKLRRANIIPDTTKVKLYETFVVSMLLCGLEYWCLRKEDKRRILTAEMTWLSRPLRESRHNKMRKRLCGAFYTRIGHWLIEQHSED